MITLTLTRSEQTADGVFGVLTGAGLSLHTMEDDWRDNAARVSCIPAGTYTLRRTIYHKHGYPTYEVTGVPGRSRILIHPANTEEDVEGCIGLGLGRDRIKVKKDEDTGEVGARKRAVISSKEAFRRFMDAMDGADTATLVIAWAPGLPLAAAA